MNKTELIKALSAQSGVSQHDVRRVVDALFAADDGVVSQVLAARESITISGFGVFSVVHRKARLGRNPRTGEAVKVAPTHAAVFRPAPALKARVSGAS
jgi:nucleoid DNA-binding protein